MRRLLKRSLIAVGLVGLLWVGVAAGSHGTKPCRHNCPPPTTSTTTTTSTTNPPPTLCANAAYCADFETGNLSQWTYVPLEGTGTITVNTDAPVKQGIYSAKFQTRPATTGSQRAELNASQAQTDGYPGHEAYYGWWTYLPSVNGQPQQWQTNTGDWNVLAQFQSVDWTPFIGVNVDLTSDYYPGTEPKLTLGWSGGPHRINGRGKELLADPLQYDHWYHFIVHAKWSTDPSVGFLQVWLDGAEVVPQTFGQTLFNTSVTKNELWTAPGTYAELDLYHGPTPYTNTVIHDGFCHAATYADAAAC